MQLSLTSSAEDIARESLETDWLSRDEQDCFDRGA